MKKALNNTRFMIALTVILFIFAAYFAFNAFVKYRVDLTELNDEGTVVQSTSLNQQSTQAEEVTEETELSAYDKRLAELEQELRELRMSNSTYTEENEINAFLKEFDSAVDYDVSAFDTYKAKQNYIRNKLEKYFTEDGFKNSPYYEYCTADEIITQEVSGKTIEYKLKVANHSMDFSRTYLKQDKEKSRYDVFVEVECEQNDKFLLLTVGETDEGYKISNYKEIGVE